MPFPITGWPMEVINPIANAIAEVIARNSISEFYIGRTNDLSATQSRHGCDDIINLYKTDSVDNAIQVENALIKTFYEHQKCNNEEDHSGGGASDDYICYVYLAVWYS